MTTQPELAVTPSWGRRIIGIEGLRGLAAMTVLVHHTSNHLVDPGLLGLTGGRVVVALANGLTLFFVLSGFLLFRPFVSALLNGTAAPRIGRYFRNRALRIYPAYIVIFLIAALLMGSVYTGSIAMTGEEGVGRITDPFTFAADVLLVQTYFPQTILTGLGVAWSLTAEIAFYVILPVLFILGVFLLRRRVPRIVAALVPAVLMIVVGVVATAFLALISRGMDASQLNQFEWGNTWWAVLNRSVVAQADLFGYGMLAAVVVAILEKRGLVRVAGWQRVLLLLTVGIIGIGGSMFGGHVSTNLVGIACALLVVATVLPGHVLQKPSRFARALEWLPFRYVGLVSYSIYLWHVPVIWWLRMNDLYEPSTLGGAVISIALVAIVTLLFASATYYLVEKPAMSLKDRTYSRAPAAAQRAHSS